MNPEAPFGGVDEERLERLSVLRELSVAAIELFDVSCSIDAFLERMAERLGCSAVLVLERSDAGGAEWSLLASAGLSRASRSVPIPTGTVREPTSFDEAPALPYPELRNRDTSGWAFPMTRTRGTVGADAARLLLVYFQKASELPPAYRKITEQLVTVLAATLSHRNTVEALARTCEEMARAQEQLVRQERLTALGEMAAVVAHEIRNPLGAVFNATGALRRRFAPGDEARAYIDVIQEESERLNHIVGDLLDYASPRRPDLEPDRIDAVLASAVETVETSLDAKGRVGISVDIEPELPVLQMDARMLRQAFINLIVNAAQATEQGGQVRVRAVSEIDRARKVVRIDVSDDGPGVPEDLQPRIFEPFFTTKARGTGVGLAVVQHIVRAHHGQVTVTSDSGGATFSVRLPVDAATLT